MKHYEVEFYEDEHGNCAIADWLRELDKVNSKERKSNKRNVNTRIGSKEVKFDEMV